MKILESGANAVSADEVTEGVVIPPRALYLIVAFAAGLIAAEALFDKFDFCPVCGGDGMVTVRSLFPNDPDAGSFADGSYGNDSERKCPLLWLFPQWHSGEAA